MFIYIVEENIEDNGSRIICVASSMENAYQAVRFQAQAEAIELDNDYGQFKFDDIEGVVIHQKVTDGFPQYTITITKYMIDGGVLKNVC